MTERRAAGLRFPARQVGPPQNPRRPTPPLPVPRRPAAPSSPLFPAASVYTLARRISCIYGTLARQGAFIVSPSCFRAGSGNVVFDFTPGAHVTKNHFPYRSYTIGNPCGKVLLAWRLRCPHAPKPHKSHVRGGGGGGGGRTQVQRSNKKRGCPSAWLRYRGGTRPTARPDSVVALFFLY